MNNSLDQYTDLYLRNADAFAAGSPDALNRLRPDALDELRLRTLPEKGDEGYEKTSLNDMFAPDFGLNVNRVNLTADIAASFRCDVPNMSTLLAVTVNDTFHPTAGLETRLPDGVVFTSFRQAAANCPRVLDTHYGTLADLTRPEVALNTLLAQDGVLIYVPRGVRPDKPLQLVNIFAGSQPTMAVRRVLIVVEEGASLQLLMCDHTQPGTARCLSSQVIEAVAGAGAELEICDIEESAPDTARASSLFLHQGDNSRVLVNGVTLTCGNTRNDFSVDIHGSRADTRIAGMAIGGPGMAIDNSSVLRHLAPRSKSNQLFKYVMDADSTGAFEGTILVTPEAPFTEAYQSNRNILASRNARMHTRPQLEIYNDDVKCSHGATTGQLDSKALFYMRTRGVPEHEARVMLMQAFMTDVIDTVRMEGLRDRLRHLVEKRFAGTAGTCADCSATCRK